MVTGARRAGLCGVILGCDYHGNDHWYLDVVVVGRAQVLEAGET